MQAEKSGNDTKLKDQKMMAQTRDWTSEIQKSVKNTARMSIKD